MTAADHPALVGAFIIAPVRGSKEGLKKGDHVLVDT